jgi:dolichol-phosphate mannosyltransferase
MELSVIIPIYNEEENIHLLYERLVKVCSEVTASFEFIFINDGSADRSVYLIRQLAALDSRIKFIDLSRNFGHQIAVSAGIDHATGEAIVIIDADLQDPPELINDLYRKWKEGYQVVYAKRKSRQGESFMKKTTAKWFYRILQSLPHINIQVDTGDFRIIDRRIANTLKQMPEQHKFLRGQISWIGFNQTFVEYERAERNAGQTGYTYRKMIRLALDGITSFSDLPLKFATFAGFFISIVSFLLILYALYAKAYDPLYQRGWASQIISILFIGGVQLIGIGIIGEYISRLSHNIRNRPLYVVKDTNIKAEQ